MVRFGRYAFTFDTGHLTRDGHAVRLEPQPARALALLLERAGEVVSREDLVERIWGREVHVDFDRGLAYTIGQVRSALGDTADNPRFIETLPRRGFRFIAPVTPDGAADRTSHPAPPTHLEPGPSHRHVPRVSGPMAFAAVLLVVSMAALITWRSAQTNAGRPRLAVCLFDNETGDPRFDRLVAGLSDLVVSRLAAEGGSKLGVIGNLAVLRAPRERRDLARIRRETGAGFVVLGQLQHDPGGLRVIAHLLRLDDQTHVWAGRLVRDASAIETVGPQVAEEVQRAVNRYVLMIETDPATPKIPRAD